MFATPRQICVHDIPSENTTASKKTETNVKPVVRVWKAMRDKNNMGSFLNDPP